MSKILHTTTTRPFLPSGHAEDEVQTWTITRSKGTDFEHGVMPDIYPFSIFCDGVHQRNYIDDLNHAKKNIAREIECIFDLESTLVLTWEKTTVKDLSQFKHDYQ